MIRKKPSNKPAPTRADGTSTPKQRLGTVREACEYGRFSHTKCYEFIGRGDIDAYKFEGRTFIDFDSIDRMREAVLVKIKPKKEEVI
jgi:hypothetical protein